MKRVLLALVAALLLPELALASKANINSVVWRSGTYVRHVQVPADIPSNAASNPAVTTMNGVAQCLQFASTGTEYAFFQWEVPDDWVGGANMTLEVDWAANSGAMSGTDTVQWVVDYMSKAEGEALSGTTTQATVTNSDDNAQYVAVHSPFTIVYNDANNPLVHEDHVYFRITRNTGVTNDFGGTVCVTAFELIYTSEGIPEGN